MPAEVSLYLLNFVDRMIIVRSLGAAQAGVYSVGVKFAQAVNVLVRGLSARLAAARLLDPQRRRGAPRLRRRRHLFLAGCAWLVVGLWLLAQYLIRFLVAPKFFDSYEAWA